MLDLGGIPLILEIRANATLELRDMLLKNVATEKDLRAAEATYVRPDFLRVSGAPLVSFLDDCMGLSMTHDMCCTSKFL